MFVIRHDTETRCVIHIHFCSVRRLSGWEMATNALEHSFLCFANRTILQQKQRPHEFVSHNVVFQITRHNSSSFVFVSFTLFCLIITKRQIISVKKCSILCVQNILSMEIVRVKMGMFE